MPKKEQTYAVLRGGHSVARLCICNDCLLFLPGPFTWISPSSLSLTALLQPEILPTPLHAGQEPQGRASPTPSSTPGALKCFGSHRSQLPHIREQPQSSAVWRVSKAPEFTFSLDDDPKHLSASGSCDCSRTQGP